MWKVSSLWLHRHSEQQTGTFLPSTLGQVPRGLGERDHLPASDGFQTIARGMLGCAVRIMVNSDDPPIRSSSTRMRMPVGTAANSDDDLRCSPYADVSTAVAHFLIRSSLWTNRARRGIIFAFFTFGFCVLRCCPARPGREWPGHPCKKEPLAGLVWLVIGAGRACQE